MKPLLIVLGLLLTRFALTANPLMVCESCPIRDIQRAIEMANPGDEVRVLAGEYAISTLNIDKRLRLIGEGMPILRGNKKDELLIITADSVEIIGIEFRDAGKSNLKDLAAIRVRGRKGFVIQSNRIMDAYFGIYIEKGKQGLIADNVLIGQAVDEMSSGNAIHAWDAKQLRIVGNEVRGYRDGIYLEFVNESEIRDNISVENIRYGLHFMFSNDDSYTCNLFRDNGAGVAVMFSKRIEMRYNRFEHNWGRSSYGLLLKEIYDAEIEHNTFDKNTIGILLEGSTRLNYRFNEFRANGWAVQMSGGCLDNNFSFNDFLYNSNDLVINGRVNNNTFDNNYWSSYSGYDLDRDGAGDVAYRPVKLYSYIQSQAPESIILMRSFFIDLLNFSEKVSPVFTPENVLDHRPLINRVL